MDCDLHTIDVLAGTLSGKYFFSESKVSSSMWLSPNLDALIKGGLWNKAKLVLAQCEVSLVT